MDLPAEQWPASLPQSGWTYRRWKRPNARTFEYSYFPPGNSKRTFRSRKEVERYLESEAANGGAEEGEEASDDDDGSGGGGGGGGGGAGSEQEEDAEGGGSGGEADTGAGPPVGSTQPTDAHRAARAAAARARRAAKKLKALQLARVQMLFDAAAVVGRPLLDGEGKEEEGGRAAAEAWQGEERGEDEEEEGWDEEEELEEEQEARAALSVDEEEAEGREEEEEEEDKIARGVGKGEGEGAPAAECGARDDDVDAPCCSEEQMGAEEDEGGSAELRRAKPLRPMGGKPPARARAASSPFSCKQAGGDSNDPTTTTGPLGGDSDVERAAETTPRAVSAKAPAAAAPTPTTVRRAAAPRPAPSTWSPSGRVFPSELPSRAPRRQTEKSPLSEAEATGLQMGKLQAYCASVGRPLPTGWRIAGRRRGPVGGQVNWAFFYFTLSHSLRPA